MSIAVLLFVSACGRLTGGPAQYSALDEGGSVNDNSFQIDDEAPRITKKRPMRSGTNKAQSSSLVDPSAVLEASIIARRNWKPQNIADLENVRPAIAMDKPANSDVTAMVKDATPLAQ